MIIEELIGYEHFTAVFQFDFDESKMLLGLSDQQKLEMKVLEVTQKDSLVIKEGKYESYSESRNGIRLLGQNLSNPKALIKFFYFDVNSAPVDIVGTTTSFELKDSGLSLIALLSKKEGVKQSVESQLPFERLCFRLGSAYNYLPVSGLDL